MAKCRTRRETLATPAKSAPPRVPVQEEKLRKCVWVAEKPLEIHLSIWRHL